MTGKKAVVKRGKAVNIYLKEADILHIRGLFAYIAAKGHNVSDSQIIAAALRVAKADSKFLKAFEAGLLLDARRKNFDG
jgi:hypothetical protein